MDLDCSTRLALGFQLRAPMGMPARCSGALPGALEANQLFCLFAGLVSEW